MYPRALSLLLGLALSTTAVAGKCDSHLRRGAALKGEAVVDVYKQMLACDKGEAEQGFDEFMRAAGEVGAIVNLSLVAIDAEAYTPVWNMMEKIPDYDARDEIGKGIGSQCADHPQVIPFLQGAYFGLRDIQFGQWDDAFLTCESATLNTWTQGIVAQPPKSVYDEKYNTIITSFALNMRAAALPVLEQAAIGAATEGGPFNAIIEKMDQAVRPPELGGQMSPEDREALEGALVRVANAVDPEQAALVADRLFNAGAETAAASLLPRIYPDRVQADDTLLYGAAAVEACEGHVVVHVAGVREPSKRWSILSDIEAPLHSFRHRLKCTTVEPWPVFATPEPVANHKEIDTWVLEILAQWDKDGNEVKLRVEKDITLP
ncbi:MAG: hypothetical protein JXX28_19680 [Deltaproteobacteria bacterium]|nr:hypothetical protein [Deltaproteobacteria bacterium]